MSDAPRPYADCAQQVLREAKTPLTVEEIIEGVGKLRPMTSTNPKGTISSTLSQSEMCVNMGDGTFRWLPDLLKKVHVRLPVGVGDLEEGALLLTPEAIITLWPGRTEAAKRQPAPEIRLVPEEGEWFDAVVENIGPGRYRIAPNPALKAWYEACKCTVEDDLIVAVIDAHAALRQYRLRHIPARQRNSRRVDARGEHVAKVLLDGYPYYASFTIWQACEFLLTRGAYDDPMPPDMLSLILSADDDFTQIEAGLYRRSFRLPQLWRGAPPLSIPPRPPTAPGEMEVPRLVRRLFSGELSPEESWATLERLRMVPAIVSRHLLKLAHDPEPDQHHPALMLIGELDLIQTAAELYEMLRGPGFGDDHKVSIIQALINLDAVEPDEHPYRYLADPEGMMARQDRQMMQAFSDPVQLDMLLNSILDEGTTPIDEPQTIEALAQKDDPRLLSLFLCFLHHPEDRTVLAAIQALESLRQPEAIAYLEERAERDRSRKVRNAAKTAAGRLTMRVSVGNLKPAPRRELGEIVRVIISCVDGSGTQVLVAIREPVDDDIDDLAFYNLMFDDRTGLKGCFGGFVETADQLEEIMQESSDIDLPFGEITLEQARQIVAEAYQTTLKARSRLPLSFLAWRDWLDGDGPEGVESNLLPDVPEDEREHLLAISGELHELNEFVSWFFEKQDLGGYERRYLRLPERERDEDHPAVRDIVSKALKTIMAPAMCRRISRRLRRQAFVLAQVYSDPEIPLSALVAADDIDDPNTPIQDNPFLRLMLYESLLMTEYDGSPPFPNW